MKANKRIFFTVGFDTFVIDDPEELEIFKKIDYYDKNKEKVLRQLENANQRLFLLTKNNRRLYNLLGDVGELSEIFALDNKKKLEYWLESNKMLKKCFIDHLKSLKQEKNNESN